MRTAVATSSRGPKLRVSSGRTRRMRCLSRTIQFRPNTMSGDNTDEEFARRQEVRNLGAQYDLLIDTVRAYTNTGASHFSLTPALIAEFHRVALAGITLQAGAFIDL